MTKTDELKKAYLEGYADAMKMYAVWKDGKQFIGVRQRPLAVELEKLHLDPMVLASLNIFMEVNG